MHKTWCPARKCNHVVCLVYVKKPSIYVHIAIQIKHKYKKQKNFGQRCTRKIISVFKSINRKWVEFETVCTISKYRSDFLSHCTTYYFIIEFAEHHHEQYPLVVKQKEKISYIPFFTTTVTPCPLVVITPFTACPSVILETNLAKL